MMIEVKNITKYYGRDRNKFTALSDVSVTIPDGAQVAILGKSGSGKSTLMHVMSGLDRAQEGDIIVDGKSTTNLKEKALNNFRVETIGFIFQDFFVQGNETVYDNVSLPLEIADVSRTKRAELIKQALAAVDLSEKIKSKAKDLSGGQKQRLAIARAIVNKPRIIFADEPTGNLDSVTSALIEKLLFRYSKETGATLVIVTHDEELASKCGMTIRIKDGAIESVR